MNILRHSHLVLGFILFSLFNNACADNPNLHLESSAAIVMDQPTGAILYEKKSHERLPIASITKLMTAMVLLDSNPNLRDQIEIAAEDVDTLRNSHSRLPVGTELSVEEMLRLALMSSENRAASALSRHYPGGKPAFVKAMNAKARKLALRNTHFLDPTGLNTNNVSSARDLAKMVVAAADYPLIREMTTTQTHEQQVGRRTLTFNNTNALVKNGSWKIDVSKTGYINESGKCLVMQTWIKNRPTVIVLLDSWGHYTPVGDSNRIKKWIDSGSFRRS